MKLYKYKPLYHDIITSVYRLWLYLLLLIRNIEDFIINWKVFNEFLDLSDFINTTFHKYRFLHIFLRNEFVKHLIGIYGTIKHILYAFFRWQSSISWETNHKLCGKFNFVHTLWNWSAFRVIFKCCYSTKRLQHILHAYTVQGL